MAKQGGDAPEIKFDKHEQVGFQQGEASAHDALIGQYMSAAGSDNSQVAGKDQLKQNYVGEDGKFKYLTKDETDKMDLKQFAAYVKAHDDYTKQQVACHGDKLGAICANYGVRLDNDMTKQSYATVQDFYGNLKGAIEKT